MWIWTHAGYDIEGVLQFVANGAGFGRATMPVMV